MNRKSLYILLLALVSFAGHSETVTVTAGMTIPVELMENVHSSFNTQGQTVYLRVAEPLVVSGKTAIAKGSLVEAEVGGTQGTGMVGKSGSVSFHPARVAAADGQWLALDPTSFGDQGDGPGTGMILAIGLFAKGKPGFVPRGTTYRVTLRRDTEVDVDASRPNDTLRAAADVKLSGRVKPLQTVNMARSKPGRAIEFELDLSGDTVSLVPIGATSVRVVSVGDAVPEKPVESMTVQVDPRRNVLVATFDWWSVIRYARPGGTPVIVQIELADGRLAQAELTIQSEWKTG